MFGKYSFCNLMKIYNKNKPVFDAYLNRHSIEGFSDEDSENNKVDNIPILFIILFIIMHLIILVWAVYIIIIRWKIMPEWAKAVSIICLLINMPVFSVVCVYASTMK